MRYTKLAVILIFLLSMGFTLAQEGTTDPCEGVTCSESTTTCPDGYEASCSNTCTDGECSSCTPDCSGHEATTEETTPEETTEESTPETTEETTPETTKETLTETPPETTTTMEECICTEQYDPVCGFDDQTYGNECEARCANVDIKCHEECPCEEFECPEIPPPEPDFCSDGNTIARYDDRGCLTGYDCERKECGNRICEAGEDKNNCPDDCRRVECPHDRVCPDGRRVPCFPEGDECRCEECPPKLPEECWEERDESGFVRVVCKSEKRCPEIPPHVKERCLREGGRPVFRKDPHGCEFLDCQFGEEGGFNPITGYERCPPPEEIEEVMLKCKKLGIRGVIVFEGGCKIARCIQKEELECRRYHIEEKEKIERECHAEGLVVIKDFDENGCPFPRCGRPGECARDLPQKAYGRCKDKGGEMIVKRDDRGCIALAECLNRGDERYAYVERIERIPEATELLGIAFKLENLKIELDKLARQTDEIADYYTSIGSSEEERFRRVSDMFDGAKDKVDHIKMKLRDRLEDINVDDLMEIRHDIRYIKDVMFKDILYVMLSSGEDIREIISDESGDCGTDGMCFDRAFRVCKPVTFYPEGERGPRVEVIGLEDSKCVMKVILDENFLPPEVLDLGPPYEFMCKIPDYSMGIRDPQTDVLPYCEGELADFVIKHGKTGPPDEFPRERGFEERRIREIRPDFERGEREPCSGCLDNGVCDPGECADCPDCMR